jgi:hypothetical protein
MNQQECWKALEEGETLIWNSYQYKNIDGVCYVSYASHVQWTKMNVDATDFINNKSIKIDCSWFKDITKPVFCWCSDDEASKGDIYRVINFDECATYPFSCTDGSIFKYAIPCDKLEVLAFVLGE